MWVLLEGLALSDGCPQSTGILATMASTGVSWSFPPNGWRTVPAPTEESNISPSPFWLHELSSERAVVNFSSVPLAATTDGSAFVSGDSCGGAVTWTDVSSWTPLVSRKARKKSTIFLPL